MPIATIPPWAEPRGAPSTNVVQSYDLPKRITLNVFETGVFGESEIVTVTAALSAPPEVLGGEQHAGIVELSREEFDAIPGAAAFLDALVAAIMNKWPPPST
jgi:hypothetical protein